MSIEWYCVSSNLKVKLFYKCKMKCKSLTSSHLQHGGKDRTAVYFNSAEEDFAWQGPLIHLIFDQLKFATMEYIRSVINRTEPGHVLHVHLHERAHVESEVFTLHSDKRYLSYIYSTEYYTALHWCFKNVLDALYSFGIFSYIWLRNK